MARNQPTSSRKAPASQSRRTWNQSRESRRSGGNITRLLTLAGGAGIGAALMYLLDPEAGERRRQLAAERTKEALEASGAALGTAIGSSTQALESAWETVSGQAQHAAAAIGESLPDRKALRRATHDARETAGSWLSSAGEYLPSFHRRRPGVSPTNATAISLACLAAGIGAMWLLDPSRGRGRRAWIGQKAARVVNETGHFFNSTGRHLRNKTKGYVHDAGAMAHSAGEYLTDPTLAERVRSTLGRLGLRGSSIGVGSKEGRIGLTGHCAADDVNQVLVVVRGVPGVRGIDNEMDVGDMYPTSTTPNTSNLSA